MKPYLLHVALLSTQIIGCSMPDTAPSSNDQDRNATPADPGPKKDLDAPDFRMGDGRDRVPAPSEKSELHFDYFGLTREEVKFYHVRNRGTVYTSSLHGPQGHFLRDYTALIGTTYDEVASHYVSNHRGYTALYLRDRIIIETMTGYRGSWTGLLCIFDDDRLSVVKQLGRGAYGDLIYYDSSLATGGGPTHEASSERTSTQQ